MVPQTPPDASLPLNELLAVARDLQEFVESQRWQFCFIGGLAVQMWSEPRYTRDVDLTLLTGFGREMPFVDALLARYRSRRPDAREFALANRVLLLQSDSGIGIDIAMGALDFEMAAARRAQPVEVYPGLSLRLCSAEDLIVMKAFAGREQDWRDVRFTIVRQGVETLDWRYILRHLTELAALKEAPEILDRLNSLRTRYKPQQP